VLVIVPINEAALVMSLFLRKTAAHAIPKLYSLVPEMKEELITVVVIGSADMAFGEVCHDMNRGLIYSRLLSTDPAAAKEVFLAGKPLIAEETDLLEPTLLDEHICHIASLASGYHKPPTALFVE
jgi:AP-1 complex subunit beta-1